MYYTILYYTIPRAAPFDRLLERDVLGAAAPWETARFKFWELFILYYYVIIYHTVLFYAMPRSALAARPPERGFGGRPPPEHCIILYYTKIGPVRSSVGAGRSPRITARLHFLFYFIILYYTTLYSTKVGPARSSARAEGSPLATCKISIVGIVDHIALYCIIL